MLADITLSQIGLWIVYISLPILVLYFIYLFFSKAFRYMGFSSVEAFIILFVSFLFGFEIIILGVNISNIYLFSFGNWNLWINMGGAVIPILLSIYLIIKKKLPLKKIAIGIIIVTIIAFLVTQPNENKGIVATIPYAFLPALFASITSMILLWKDFIKAAPLAYISGTIGVLIGADFLHLWELLNIPIKDKINAIIGGADVFDMIFITGIIAVVLDGLIMFRQRKNINIT
jgi:uncharacterized membrane protein